MRILSGFRYWIEKNRDQHYW